MKDFFTDACLLFHYIKTTQLKSDIEMLNCHNNSQRPTLNTYSIL